LFHRVGSGARIIRSHARAYRLNQLFGGGGWRSSRIRSSYSCSPVAEMDRRTIPLCSVIEASWTIVPWLLLLC
jgi:hypothetical protein